MQGKMIMARGNSCPPRDALAQARWGSNEVVERQSKCSSEEFSSFVYMYNVYACEVRDLFFFFSFNWLDWL